MKIKVKAWIPVLIWMGVIYMFSAQPASASSQMSGSLMKWLVGIIDVTPIPEMLGEELLHTLIRKMAHFTVYFVLGVLVYRATHEGAKMEWKHIWIPFFICMAYAASDELHQLYVPGRSGQVTDVLIDSSGALLGILVTRTVQRWRV